MLLLTSGAFPEEGERNLGDLNRTPMNVSSGQKPSEERNEEQTVFFSQWTCLNEPGRLRAGDLHRRSESLKWRLPPGHVLLPKRQI